jgi:PAS domain S-box-containing protein
VVEERTPLRVVLVVADAPGDKRGLKPVLHEHPWSQPDDVVVDPSPDSRGCSGICDFERAVGGDVEQALAGIPVPSYVLDTDGVVRWINPAAERLLGDVRGRHFTSIVGPEDRARAQELFARKVLGTTAATEASGVFVSRDGTRLTLEVSAVPLDEETSPPPAHLTPRQAEVLRLLEQGRSTKQIAQELHLSTETVKNHVRHLLRALGVNSRLEAVAAVRRGGATETRDGVAP